MLTRPIPTKPGPLLRLRLAIHAAYLRLLIGSVESDIEYHDDMAVLAPKAAAMARQYRDELRIKLIDCELGRRLS